MSRMKMLSTILFSANSASPEVSSLRKPTSYGVTKAVKARALMMERSQYFNNVECGLIVHAWSGGPWLEGCSKVEGRGGAGSEPGS